jgi:hypothetical protein
MKARPLMIFALPLALGLGACTVEQTQEGESPVVEPGRMPEYDVQPADVDLSWDTTTVRTPDLDVRSRGDTLRDTIR